MIAHVVLFQPRADLSPDARAALAAAFEAALREIPSIRRARVGARVRQGHGYEALMTVDYQYAAILEFADAAGLKAYLEHPAHSVMAARFYESFEHALMYDFDLQDGLSAIDALR
jgi:hypothetical protein